MHTSLAEEPVNRYPALPTYYSIASYLLYESALSSQAGHDHCLHYKWYIVSPILPVYKRIFTQDEYFQILYSCRSISANIVGENIFEEKKLFRSTTEGDTKYHF